jgi:hypothetical protein
MAWLPSSGLAQLLFVTIKGLVDFPLVVTGPQPPAAEHHGSHFLGGYWRPGLPALTECRRDPRDQVIDFGYGIPRPEPRPSEPRWLPRNRHALPLHG